VSLIRRGFLESVQRVLLAALLIVVLAGASLTVHVIWTWRQEVEALSAATTVAPGAATTVPTAASVDGRPVQTPAATSPPSVLPPVSPHKIGIVVGHWQSDVGAVCPDGLTEVDINLDVAQRVVSKLNKAGYDAEILAEFSPELNGYQAGALVSIHTDSCNVPEATGFKVARVSSSMVPELEDRLVACLSEQYGQATGLAFHENSITFDMTEYHAFFEIAPETPAAIIEIGFMDRDRRLLTRRQERVASGIVDGIKCFFEGLP
jgi:N-acetylmuramoyl-L-alanine amidase